MNASIPAVDSRRQVLDHMAGRRIVEIVRERKSERKKRKKGTREKEKKGEN